MAHAFSFPAAAAPPKPAAPTITAPPAFPAATMPTAPVAAPTLPGAAQAAQAAATAAASAALPGFNFQALIGQQIQSQIQQAATAAAQAATAGLLGADKVGGRVHSSDYTSPNKRMNSGGLLGSAPTGGPKRQNYDGNDNGYQNNSFNNQSYGEQAAPVAQGPRVALDRHGNQRVLSSSVKGSALSRLGARDDGYANQGQNVKEQPVQDAQSDKDYTKMSTDSVFVEGLPAGVDRKTVSDFFSQVGPLRPTGTTAETGIGRIFLFMNEEKQCDGSCSVTYQQMDDATNCLALLQGKGFPMPKDKYNGKLDASNDDLAAEGQVMKSDNRGSDSESENDDGGRLKRERRTGKGRKQVY